MSCEQLLTWNIPNKNWQNNKNHKLKTCHPKIYMNLTPVGVAPPKSHALLGCARVIKTRS
jgi:hypothetical protein